MYNRDEQDNIRALHIFVHYINVGVKSPGAVREFIKEYKETLFVEENVINHVVPVTEGPTRVELLYMPM